MIMGNAALSILSLSGLQVEDFTVTEIPIEEGIARFYQKEAAEI